MKSVISHHTWEEFGLYLFDEAGMSPEFMWFRLHWLGELYRLYLCNTSVIQAKHINSLRKDSDKLMLSLGPNKDLLPDLVPLNTKMGDFVTKN